MNILIADNYGEDKGYFTADNSIKKETIYINKEQAKQMALELAQTISNDSNEIGAIVDIILYGLETACVIEREKE